MRKELFIIIVLKLLFFLILFVCLHYIINDFPKIILSQVKQNGKEKFERQALVNDIIFKDSTLNKYAFGNGFLIKHKKDTFAVTAKHILTLVKTKNMKTVTLNADIENWKMRSKDGKKGEILIDKLLNTSKLDTLDFEFMVREGKNYADWLVFSIKSNSTNVKPIEIRASSLKVNEPLYVYGWTFNDSLKVPRYEYRYYGDAGANFTMKRVITRKNEFGLSGSPVTDENGLLVGIVSTTIRDSITNEILNAPSKVSHLKQILKNLK